MAVTIATMGYAQDRPNILLILSDDHSVPHLGAYGCPNCERFEITPNLDAFAAEGMRFDHAYTAAPQCAPSRTSIFAGRSPVGLSATRFSQPAESNVPLFTDLLRDHGYWVGLDGRHQHLDGRNRDSDHVSEELEELHMRGERFETRFDHFVRGSSTKGEGFSEVPNLFGNILDQIPEGDPFFLYFGFSQPHRKFGTDHEGIDPAKLELPADWPDLPEVRLDYARFLDEVRDLDSGFGAIMRILEERNEADTTLVIFMGDNGEALLRGKGTLFRRGLHVPLLIRWPGKVAPSSVSDVLVSGVDLAPTLLRIAGTNPASGMTGVSFAPELLGNPFKGRTQLFGERGWHWGPITRTDGFDLSRSITTKSHHFIYNALPDRPYTPVDMATKNIAWDAIQTAHQAGELSETHARLYFRNPRPIFELYDVEEDPFQLTNLAGRESMMATQTKLRESLDRWMIREGDYLPLPSHALQILTK
ncbi:MAG: sulfatase [Verrucomicrobiota bacterium]